VQINSSSKELTLKIVYYGPALSGKTTNVERLHHMLHPDRRGRLMVLDTKGDRTLFFDLLPVHFETRSGFRVKMKLYTVPGQVMHESTRKIVLAGCDAICFVADGQKEIHAQNNEAFSGMQKNLRANGLDPASVPTVIQFNKLDLPNALSERALAQYAAAGSEPIFKAAAIRGEGVMETLQGLMSLLWTRLNRDYDFQRRFGVDRNEFMHGVFGPVEVPVLHEAARPAGGA
jgi:mutual gliding-motility protein MglA